MGEKVVLVNKEDDVLGVMDKLKAHQCGLLHRAISVFLFNDKGEYLLQQRAPNKYHSPHLWTNACCSHPRLNESYFDAATRRVNEELGIECELDYSFDFIYKADVGGELWEHELDYVFIGKFNNEPILNPVEVQDYRWISYEDLSKEIIEKPEVYTEWFKIIFKEFLKHLQ